MILTVRLRGVRRAREAVYLSFCRKLCEWECTILEYGTGTGISSPGVGTSLTPLTPIPITVHHPLLGELEIINLHNVLYGNIII